ncbi:MAG: 23S rRNA (guanosine(2251)-2'-O)-methyltransferase RlmB [Methanobacteriota archaeon]
MRNSKGRRSRQRGGAEGRAPSAYVTLGDILDIAKERGEAPLIILLDCVEDPHNLGAVVRTAECAGAHGVVIPDRRAAPLGIGALRASAGAVDYLPVARVSSIPGALDQLKRDGIWTVAADMGGRKPYYSYDFTGPTAIVIGGEDRGLGRLTKELCDDVARIPMHGETPSLNASVSAAIMIYEAVRQRARKN